MLDYKTLKRRLDALYNDLDAAKRIQEDPVEFPRLYNNPVDMETVGLISSCLAYGKVDLFKSVLRKLFKLMGRSPAEFCVNFDIKRDINKLDGIRYRFNSENDVGKMIYVIGQGIKKHGSLLNIFLLKYNPDLDDIEKPLTGFVNYFLLTERDNTPGYKQLFPSPKSGSACKRLNLFLRWMVRKDSVDIGIWRNHVSMSKLIIPLDIHIARISCRLGLLTSKSANWKSAKKITEKLRILDYSDPVKYDFALCHHGISGNCTTDIDLSLCSKCKLTKICSRENY